MAVKIQEESQTFECSFLGNKLIGQNKKYMGKRFKRSIFRSAKALLINANVNGSLNIIRQQS